MNNSKSAIFLDRDGTINTLNGYISEFEQIQIIEGVPEAICLFNKLGFLVIVVTNQPVIEMELISKADLENLHQRITLEIMKKGGHIDAFYYCPHIEVPKESINMGTHSCSCRKPRVGLIKKAVEAYNVDLTRSYMIGDTWRDVDLAKNVGLNYFKICDSTVPDNPQGNFVESLLEAALIIEKRLNGDVEFLNA
ncbi:HAD family hydrolase [bacterium]|nr:HAD family hydrolase [bacterium]